MPIHVGTRHMREWQLTQCGLVNTSVTATPLYMATRLNEVVPVAQHGVPSSYNWNTYPGQVSLVPVTLACAGTTEDSIALHKGKHHNMSC